MSSIPSYSAATRASMTQRHVAAVVEGSADRIGSACREVKMCAMCRQQGDDVEEFQMHPGLLFDEILCELHRLAIVRWRQFRSRLADVCTVAEQQHYRLRIGTRNRHQERRHTIVSRGIDIGTVLDQPVRRASRSPVNRENEWRGPWKTPERIVVERLRRAARPAPRLAAIDRRSSGNKCCEHGNV